jgi:FkbM family methyltransferase
MSMPVSGLGLDARVDIVRRLRAEISAFRWRYRHLREDLGELSLPGHQPIVFPFGAPPGLWTRLTRKTIVFDGLYEPVSTYLLSRIVAMAQPKNAFDLGSVLGYFSLVMASHADVATDIDAFEIYPSAGPGYAALKRNNPHLADRRIDVHAVAVSDRSAGAAKVWIHKTRVFETKPEPAQYRENPVMRFKHRIAGESWKTRLHEVDLRILSLDDAVAESGIVPGLIKIDVDGYEAKVLPGGMALFKAHRPWIVLEIHRQKFLEPFGTNRAALVRPLLDIGYRALLVQGRGSLAETAFSDVDPEDLAAIETDETDLLLFY